jgi:hypothetical protein
MGNRFIGALAIAATVFAAGAGQFQLSAQQPSRSAERPSLVAGHPNLNGVWQAINSANWNLEAHSVSVLSSAWQYGAIVSIPAGKSVLKGGGTIPYKPEALKQRDENRANWPENDNEAKCYMLGIPRYTYHNIPFQISQGDVDIQMVYPFAAGNRFVHMRENDQNPDPVDSWMGRSNGHWEGDVLVIVTTDLLADTRLDRSGNFHSNKLKVTERFRLIDSTHILYEATLDDPLTYTRPWTIEMPLYRLIDENAQILEHKCVPFADMLLYHDLIGDKPKP